MKGLLKLAKKAGRLTGVLGRYDGGAPTRARKVRLAATGLIVALLVWAGLPEPVAEAALELLEALVAE